MASEWGGAQAEPSAVGGARSSGPTRGGDTPEAAEVTGLPAAGPVGVRGQPAEPLPLEPRPRCTPRIRAVRGTRTPSSYTHASPLLVTVRIWLLCATPRPGRGMGTQVTRAWPPPLTLFPPLAGPEQPQPVRHRSGTDRPVLFRHPRPCQRLGQRHHDSGQCVSMWVRAEPRPRVCRTRAVRRAETGGRPREERGTQSAAAAPSTPFSRFFFTSFEIVVFGEGVGVAGGRGVAEDGHPRGQARDHQSLFY